MAKTNSGVSLPPETGAFDYQLAGRYSADARVEIISSNAMIAADPSQLPASDEPLDTTRYNICYLNVLQTQAEDYDYWLTQYPDLILQDTAGQPVHDPDPEWSGELLFDISSADKRDRLLELQRPWITSCREQGFQAIEPDNIDSYTRSLGAFGADNAQSFMEQFVAEAHVQGLAVAQKNEAPWVTEPGPDGKPRAASIGFDFAIIEECQLTEECETVMSYYGPERVLEIEYWYDTPDESSGVLVEAETSDHFDQACEARGDIVRIVLRNRDVRPDNDQGYVFALCGDTPAEAQQPTTPNWDPNSEPESDPEEAP